MYTKAFEFAVRVVNTYKFLVNEKREYVLSKQLLRCGTSVGANISEANGGISKADFSAKISIAYKECLETKYWLKLLHTTNYLNEPMCNSLYSDADELCKIMYTIIKKSRPRNY